MDTADLRADPAERLARFPSIPLTTLDEVVRRELAMVAQPDRLTRHAIVRASRAPGATASLGDGASTR